MRNQLTDLGNKIIERRQLLGLLQPQLALISGVSVRTIQAIEKGKGNPSLETLLKLIEPLGLRLSFNLKETGKNILV